MAHSLRNIFNSSTDFFKNRLPTCINMRKNFFGGFKTRQIFAEKRQRKDLKLWHRQCAVRKCPHVIALIIDKARELVLDISAAENPVWGQRNDLRGGAFASGALRSICQRCPFKKT